VCPRGKNCPYQVKTRKHTHTCICMIYILTSKKKQHEHQHASEYSHDEVKKKRRKKTGKGRKLGSKGRKLGGSSTKNNIGMWSCSQCTYSNPNNVSKCEICGATKRVPKRQKRRRTKEDTTWACSVCTVINSDDRSKCSVCGRSRTKLPNLSSSSSSRKKDPDVIDLCGSDDEEPRRPRRKRRRIRNTTKTTTSTTTSTDRRLKAEQDDAFELARAIDLSKAQQKERERKQKENEERLRQAQEKSRQTELERKKKRVGEEPKDGDLVSVMFKLPDNSRIQRKFRCEEKMEKMYFFLDVVLDEKGVKRYSTKIPPERPVKRKDANLESTFKESRLSGRIAVFVFDLDS